MSNFNNSCFVINIKLQLSNQLQQIRQPLVESKWLVTKSQAVSVTIWCTNLQQLTVVFVRFRPHEKGKALGTRLRLPKPKPNSCNYYVPCPHDTLSKGKNMSFTRKMFRILTCLFFKKKGVIQRFGSKQPKSYQKSASFSKSCQKLLSDKKVAQNPKSC